MSLENTAAPNGATESAAAPVESTSTPSMEDTIRSAYRSSMSEGAADEGGAEAETGGEASADAGRARGPDGKFLAKASETQPNSVTDPAAPAAEETQPPAANTNPDNLQRRDGKGPIDISAAPTGWRGDAKTPFGSLPETVRREIHKREDDFQKGLGQYKDAAGFGSQIAQELLPYQQTLNQHGIHPRDVVKTLAPIWNTLVSGTPQEKTQAVLSVIRDYGIDIASLGESTPQPNAQPTQEDPRLATALQRIDKLEGHLTAQERQRAEAEFSAKVDEVTKFGSDPKRSHFNAVREDMAALIESGRAADLAEAYDKAIWINPDVRASLLAAQEKERVDKAAADAVAARKAAGANVARRGTPPVTPKAGSMEDTIRREYRARQG